MPRRLRCVLLGRYAQCFNVRKGTPRRGAFVAMVGERFGRRRVPGRPKKPSPPKAADMTADAQGTLFAD